MTTAIASNMKSQVEQLQARAQLLGNLSVEKQKISAAIDHFYTQAVRNDASCLRALDEVITSCDRLIAAGDWESSPFLRNTIKPLKAMREQAWQLSRTFAWQ